MLVERSYQASPDELFTALRTALESANSKMRVRSVSAKERKVQVSTGVSMTSWGANITFKVKPLVDGALIETTGRSKLPTNFLGQPAEVEKVRAVMDSLDGRFGRLT